MDAVSGVCRENVLLFPFAWYTISILIARQDRLWCKDGVGCALAAFRGCGFGNGSAGRVTGRAICVRESGVL